MNRILQGNCIDVLKTLPSESVDCCVTSPPYYALRDYGTGEWVGGDANCDHVADASKTKLFGNELFNENRPSRGETKTPGYYKAVCPKCGARRVDNQIGLEESPPLYINRLLEVFREVKRVLKPQGTLWVNIGDSYAGSGGSGNQFGQLDKKGFNSYKQGQKTVGENVKPKDLIGIPWMLAFALRQDGWYLRQDIIWAKTNCMPESVMDRCTKSHEYIFLLSKKPKYYFDAESIKTPSSEVSKKRAEYGLKTNAPQGTAEAVDTDLMGDRFVPLMANKRDVWQVSCSSYKEAHFATFPEELIRPCIRAGCPVGGVVLDPFFGSGTTGAVAVQENRQYIGIELNPDYIKLAENRLQEQQIRIPI